MRSTFLVIVLLLGIVYASFAQQEIQYTQYILNYYLLNPALTGSQAPYDIMLGHRHQWTGLEGAPTTSWLSVHKALNYPRVNVRRRRGHHGVGGFVIRDQAGPFQQTQAHLSYAYHLPLSQKYTASVGVSAGLKQIGVDRAQVVFIQNPDDTYFGNYASTTIEPDGKLGLWLYSSRLFMGASVHQVFSFPQENRQESTEFSVPLTHHYYATLGYRLALDRDVSLIPSLLLKTAYRTPPQMDVNLKLRYQKMVWGGVSYRYQDAIAVMVGTTLREKFTLSYSYDASVTRLSNSSNGSHEVVLGLTLPPRGRVVCPDQFW